MRRLLLRLLPLLLGFAHGAAAAEHPPRVVTTIQPVHSLVAGIMEGVGSPELLLPGGASPHAYALRPSQAHSLARADVVFRVDEGLETFLRKPLEALGARTRVVTLSGAPGVRLLPPRRSGIWGEDGHGHGDEDHGRGAVDAHIWLDPANAKAMVRAAAAQLGALYPRHAGRFGENARKLSARLDALDAELRQRLAPVKDAPFIVFHDAYQYFEGRYGLKGAGSITVDPGRTPGARRLNEIRRAIRERRALCVFAEPQFEPRLVATVLEGTGARRGILDPLGADVPPGPEAYFTLMRNLAANFAGCLGGK